ncbi:hypothetical protein [Psychroflexus lacisalsi]|uniref:DUF4129 domain-containing protein n=2 Tax=Psychroflexus lacisalsi TaxID=503928 RepID=A0ABP3VLV9_9FLAO|nr:hypothetical protein [Psychroflexus lacisalsi]MBZ9619780.1 hypothetical protein [Psychroflexus lacisalsi]
MEVKSYHLLNSLVFIFILNWVGTGFMTATPQLQASDSLKKRPDLVEFDKSIVDSYKINEDYNYFKTAEQESAWAKFQNWLNLQWNKFLDWIFSGISEGNFWNYLALVLKILLIVGLLFLIVWLFNKYYVQNRKNAPENKSEINLSEDERLIKKKDLSTLIEEAESDDNFRLASRYLFLNILKHLKETNIIEYQFQKTNADYKSEISDEEIKSDFTYASRFYEFVWYGDFELNATEYNKAKDRFEELITTIHKTKVHG